MGRKLFLFCWSKVAADPIQTVAKCLVLVSLSLEKRTI
ncbi:hypothetical protein ACJW30_02G041000 [Castanea mollissima]